MEIAQMIRIIAATGKDLGLEHYNLFREPHSCPASNAAMYAFARETPRPSVAGQALAIRLLDADAKQGERGGPDAADKFRRHLAAKLLAREDGGRFLLSAIEAVRTYGRYLSARLEDGLETDAEFRRYERLYGLLQVLTKAAMRGSTGNSQHPAAD
jgi:hypothetical protein